MEVSTSARYKKTAKGVYVPVGSINAVKDRQSLFSLAAKPTYWHLFLGPVTTYMLSVIGWIVLMIALGLLLGSWFVTLKDHDPARDFVAIKNVLLKQEMETLPLMTRPSEVVDTEPTKLAEYNVCESKLATLLSSNRILFQSGSVRLTDASITLVKNLSKVLNEHCPTINVLVNGYTDSTGDPNTNQLLSENRALVVARLLNQQGVGEGRITARGFGARDPVADNMTKHGRALNRRIEIILDYQK